MFYFTIRIHDLEKRGIHFYQLHTPYFKKCMVKSGCKNKTKIENVWRSFTVLHKITDDDSHKLTLNFRITAIGPYLLNGD
jgi:hypothetical protein